MAWSLSTPPHGPIEPRLSFAILFELGSGLGLTRCTQVPQYWNLGNGTFRDNCKCMFSRFFHTSEGTDGRGTAAAPFAQRMRTADLDNVALFREPKLVSLRFKKGASPLPTGEECQHWGVEKACTNCLAAGTWGSCTHWLKAMGMSGTTQTSYITVGSMGQQSAWDVERGPEHDLLEAIGDMQLIEMEM